MQKSVSVSVKAIGTTVQSVTLCCIAWFDSLMLQVQVQKPVGSIVSAAGANVYHCNIVLHWPV